MPCFGDEVVCALGGGEGGSSVTDGASGGLAQDHLDVAELHELSVIFLRGPDPGG
jgi:hypothetical protein